MNRRNKICFVVSSPMTAQAFLQGHICSLAKDFDVYLVANFKSHDEISELYIKDAFQLDIYREISIKHDIAAVAKLYSYFRRERFDAVHSITPKAGLITALAAYLSGIKHRIHIFTGQVWATKHGFDRFLLKSIDKLIVLLDTDILIDGKSQRQFLLSEGVLSARKSQVFGEGSISGVNIDKFTPDDTIRNKVRKEIGIPNDDIVYMFLGRLNRDKGIYELLSSFNKLAANYKNVYLLIAGSDEEGCLKHLPEYPSISDKENFHYYGFTKTPEILLNAGDIFCLPSYREGFGSSVIEASSMELAVICSDTYGVMDAMVDNETGLRCKVADIGSLYDCMAAFVKKPSLIRTFGMKGRQRVIEKFSGELVTNHWVDFYHTLLNDKV
ncbi:glycosyltransferase [Prevotella sp. kh1p2]|uniref:glycosyltransferase n=1 Tax=Prevotella sp. kh1p2 TaxID=1761883 RepID=UPI0008BA688B|nr:glycosyltransferase [Prevotella sp. kh1p2]SET11079.1 Glycosyltransferase involved in cell wall bisynthesis [Prevotella sp. kh1p2]SNU11828.1 Glycosyltransferase involved in cell wall bisynthesis [Prevotellaceae bacterium KH2P17]